MTARPRNASANDILLRTYARPRPRLAPAGSVVPPWVSEGRDPTLAEWTAIGNDPDQWEAAFGGESNSARTEASPVTAVRPIDGGPPPLPAPPAPPPAALPAAPLVIGAGWLLLTTASMAASGYHGMKRHRGSIAWGAWWAFMGGMVPGITPAIGAAQGFAEPLPPEEA